MSENVKSLNLPVNFPKEGELMERLSVLIDEYAGEISLVSVVGVLALKQNMLINSGLLAEIDGN